MRLPNWASNVRDELELSYVFLKLIKQYMQKFWMLCLNWKLQTIKYLTRLLFEWEGLI